MIELRLRDVSRLVSDETKLQVVVSDDAGVAHAFGGREGVAGVVLVPDVATFRFRPGSGVVTAEVAADADRPVVFDAYYGICLPLALQGVFGYEALHASAVCAAGGVIVFCGTSRTGKSTIAYGLARRGLELWADDAVAFHVVDDRITITALPFEVKLRPESLAHFGDPPVRKASEWATAPLHAVFVLDPIDEDKVERKVDISRLPASSALSALLPNGFRFLPLEAEREARIVQDYMDLVAHVPVSRLTYGRRVDVLPALLDEVEAAIAG